MTLSVSDTDHTREPHKSRCPGNVPEITSLRESVCRASLLPAAQTALAGSCSCCRRRCRPSTARRRQRSRPLGPLWQSVTEAAAAAGDGSDKCTTYSTKNDPPAIISESFLHKKLELVPLSPYRHPLPSPSGGGSSWQSPTWRIRPRKGAAAARADPLTTGRTADGVAAAAPTANVEPARECVCAA